jgi:NTE family protein
LDTPDKTFFTFVNNSIKLEKMTLNKKQYAFRGRKIFLKFNLIDGFEEHIPGTTSPEVSKSSSNHYWINVKFYNESYHRIISNRFWLGLLVEANYSNKPFFNNSTSTLLVTPNFSPTPHSKTLFLRNLRADKYFSIGLMPNIRLSKELFLRLEGYSYQPVKELLIDSKPTEIFSSAIKSVKFLGAISLVLHTPVGPLSLSLNYYPKEVKEYFLIFNYGFIMFNRRALE